jgi:hypothetical protein
MKRVTLDINDDRKAELLLLLLRDLSYVSAVTENGLKAWTGKLPVLDAPIRAGADYKMYSREELHER